MEIIELWRSAFGADGALFFDDTGSTLAAFARDRAALWRATTGERIYAGPRGGLGRQSFSADGGRAVIGDPPQIIDARSGKAVLSLPSRRGVVSAAMRGDGAFVAAILDGGDELAVWDAATGERRPGFALGESWSGGSSERRLVAVTFLGEALVTLGSHRRASWGIARHHGEADEETDIVSEMVRWDVARGEVAGEVTGDPDPDDRHGTSVLRPWSCFSGGHAIGLDGEEARLRRADDLTGDGTAIPQADCRDVPVIDDDLGLAVTVDEQGVSRLWRTTTREPVCLERLDAVVDPAGGFGLPTRPGEAAPRLRVVGSAGLAMVETWPGRRVVGQIRGETFLCLRVCPGWGGVRFAGLNDDGEIVMVEVRPGPA